MIFKDIQALLNIFNVDQCLNALAGVSLSTLEVALRLGEDEPSCSKEALLECP